MGAEGSLRPASAHEKVEQHKFGAMTEDLYLQNKKMRLLEEARGTCCTSGMMARNRGADETELETTAPAPELRRSLATGWG